MQGLKGASRSLVRCGLIAALTASFATGCGANDAGPTIDDNDALATESARQAVEIADPDVLWVREDGLIYGENIAVTDAGQIAWARGDIYLHAYDASGALLREWPIAFETGLDASDHIYSGGVVSGTGGFNVGFGNPTFFIESSDTSPDSYVAKYRIDTGELVWAMVFGQPGDQGTPQIDVSPQGDVVLTASNLGLVRISAQGAVEWQLANAAGVAAQSADELISFAGTVPGVRCRNCAGRRSSPSDLVVVAFTARGRAVWARRLADASQAAAAAVARDRLGNSYVALLHHASCGAEAFGEILKLDALGRTAWTQRVDRMQALRGIAVDPLGYVLVSGTRLPNPGTSAELPYLSKLGCNGTSIWSRIGDLGGPVFGFGYEVRTDGNADVVWSMTARPTEEPLLPGLLVKFAQPAADASSTACFTRRDKGLYRAFRAAAWLHDLHGAGAPVRGRAKHLE